MSYLRFRNLIPAALTCLACGILTTSAQAQVVTGENISKEASKLPASEESGWQAGANASYVGEGRSKFLGAHHGDSDAFGFSLDVNTRMPLGDPWSLQLGLLSENFYLNEINGFPIPGDIHTLRFNAGLSYRLDDQWTFTGVLSPTLYRFEDVDTSDVGISGALFARYRANTSLLWTFGLVVSPDSDLKVLPVVGVRWKIDDQYSLEVGMPKTRLSYRVNPDWTFYGGLDLAGTTFRSDTDLGTRIGLPRYNNALATYRDLRLGLGAGYQILKGLRAEIETGYSVYRRLDYTRIDEEVRFDPAPYVRAGLNFRF